MADPGDRAASSGGGLRRALLAVGLTIVLTLALVGVDVLALGTGNVTRALSPHYYMALGNSLSFGYQPNLDFSSGFADDIFNDLHSANVTEIVNYACAGETTTTFIQGGCVAQYAHHGSYTGGQLQAALDFLTNARNHGRVSPITLEIGANDVLQDFDPATCTANGNVDADLATLDTNLTGAILPDLLRALGTPTGSFAGDLHLLNYYNPYAKQCANSATFLHLLNDHLQADAALFKVPVVDVYSKFGGDTGTAANVCTWTWYCDSRLHDIHPTNLGYRKIADAVEAALGLPGTNPITGPVAPPAAHVAREAAFRRAAFE